MNGILENENLEEIDELRKLGVNMKYLGEKIIDDENFKGLKFVITGTINGLSRDDIKKYIELHGGSTSDSVSKKTDVVIVGENPGSKFEKAKDLNITIWNEEDILSKMK